MLKVVWSRGFLLAINFIMLVAFWLLVSRSCKERENHRKEREGWISYNSTLQEGFIERGREIGNLKVQVIKDKQAEKQLAKADSGFTRIQTVVKWKTRFLPPPATAKPVGRDTLPITLPDNGMCWPVGTRFEVVDSWRGIFARLDSNGLRDSGSFFIARPEVVMGYRKRPWPASWFVRPELSATFRDLNPYVRYEGGTAIQVQPAPVPIIQHPLFTFSFGAALGYGAGRLHQATKK